MASHDSTDKTVYLALGMVFGVAAGIGAGMLLAPRSGQETRNRLRQKAITAKEKTTDQLKEKREVARQGLNKTLDKTKEFVDKTNDKVKENADKVSERAKDAADEAKAAANS